MSKLTFKEVESSYDKLLVLDSMLEIGGFVAAGLKEMDATHPQTVSLTRCFDRYFEAMKRELEPAMEVLSQLEEDMRPAPRPN